MKKIITISIVLGIILLFYPNYAKKYSSIIRLNTNTNSETGLPKNFRIAFNQTSGSAQFTEEEIKKLLENIPHRNMVIVDLREESHGFLNGIPISWYREQNMLNIGKSHEEILADERDKLKDLSQKWFAVLYKKTENRPHIVLIKNIATSEEAVRKAGADYIRFPVTDGMHPPPHVVDAFIAFIRSLKDKDVWLHFHCSAGRGRTTTFLTMYDIINEPGAPLETLINRHESLGGVGLLDEPEEDSWKREFALERGDFIREFYAYRQANSDFAVSWSNWKAKQGRF